MFKKIAGGNNNPLPPPYGQIEDWDVSNDAYMRNEGNPPTQATYRFDDEKTRWVKLNQSFEFVPWDMKHKSGLMPVTTAPAPTQSAPPVAAQYQTPANRPAAQYSAAATRPESNYRPAPKPARAPYSASQPKKGLAGLLDKLPKRKKKPAYASRTKNKPAYGAARSGRNRSHRKPGSGNQKSFLWAIIAGVVLLSILSFVRYDLLPNISPEGVTNSGQVGEASEASESERVFEQNPGASIAEKFIGSTEVEMSISILAIAACLWAFGDSLSNESQSDWSGAVGLLLAVVAMFIGSPSTALLIIISGMILNFRGKKSQTDILVAIAVTVALFALSWWIETSYLIWKLDSSILSQAGYWIGKLLLEDMSTVPFFWIAYIIVFIFDVLYFAPIGRGKDATGQVAFHLVLLAMPIASGFFPFSSIPSDFHVWSGFENINSTIIHTFYHLIMASILISRELGLGKNKDSQSSHVMGPAFSNIIYCTVAFFLTNTLMRAYEWSLLVSMLVGITIPGIMLFLVYLGNSSHRGSSGRNFKQYAEDVLGDVVPVLVSVYPNSGVNIMIVVTLLMIIISPEFMQTISLLP